MSFVQGKIDTLNTTATHVNSFASNNAAGNTIVVIVCCYSGSFSGTTISDTQGNVYISQTVGVGSFGGLQLLYAPNCKAGANTVTTTVAQAGSNNQVIIAEYSGVISIIDQFKQNASSTANFTSGVTSATTSKNELQIGAFFQRTMPGTVAPAAGWNSRVGTVGTDNILLCDQDVAATGTYSFTGTGASTGTVWVAGIYTFRKDPGPIPTRYTIASDDFNRANESPLSDGGNFTLVTGKGTLNLVSNAITPGTVNNGCFEVWNNGSWPNDQWQSIKLTNLADVGGSINGPQGVLRGVTSGAQTYYFWLARISTGAQISRSVAGSTLSLATNPTAAGIPANGDVFVCTIVGTTITLYKNGTAILTADDSTLASGNPGVSGFQTLSSTVNLTLDDWAAGGFGSGVPNSLMMMGCGT